MNKILKVALLSIAAVMAFAVVLICIAVNVLFTSQRLTPIINDILPGFFTCQADVERVELSYFSTFPNLEVHVHGLTLVNPVPEAPTDTLLRIGQMDLDFNLSTFFYEKQLILDELRLTDLSVSLFTAADGTENFDVLAEMEESDELLPFGLQLVRIDRVNVESSGIACIDRQQQLESHLAPAALRVEGPVTYPSDVLDLTMSARVGELYYSDSTRTDLTLTHLNVADLHLSYAHETPSLDGFVMTLDSLRLAADGGLPLTEFALGGASVSLPELSLHGVDVLLPQGLSVGFETMRVVSEDVAGPTSLAVGKTSLLVPRFMLLGGEATLPEGLAATCDAFRLVIDNPADPLRLDMRRSTLAFPRLSFHEGYELSYLADIASLSLATDGRLLDGQPVGLEGAVRTDTDLSHVCLSESIWKLGDERFFLDADVRLVGDVPRSLDMRLAVGSSTFDRLLALLPSSAQEALGDIDLHGTLADAMAALSVEIVGEDSLRFRSLDVAAHLQDLRYAEGQAMWADVGQLGVNLRFPVSHEDYEQEELIETQLRVADVRMWADDASHIELQTPQFALHGYLSGQVLQDGESLPIVLMDDVSSSHLRANMDSLSLDVQNMHAALTLTDDDEVGIKYYKIMIDGEEFEAAAGYTIAAVGNDFQLETSSIYDPEQEDLLLRYNPECHVTVFDGNVEVQGLPHSFQFPKVNLDFTPSKCKIREGNIYYGKSCLDLEGTINNLRGFLLHDGPLKVNLSLKSPFVDVFELRDLIDGIGTEEAGVETEDSEMGSYLADKLGSFQPNVADSADERPFMVPLGIDLTLNTEVGSAKVGRQWFDNLGGKVMIRDGELLFEDLGFSSEAARMILNSTYRSPRADNLFLCADFHLFDVQIANLVNLVPGIDSIMPMLLSFDGQGEFHLTAETNLSADYSPKFSTLKAAALFEGADLGLLDDETFATMSRYLLFNKETRNRIDSLSLAFTVNRRRMTLYPMRIGMDKYEAVVSGEHALTDDMPFDYHVSLVKAPLVGGRLGVDVTGDISHPEDFNLRLARCRYAHLLEPSRQSGMMTRLVGKKNLIANEVKQIKRLY